MKSLYKDDQYYDTVVSSVFMMIMAIIIILTTTHDIDIEPLSLHLDFILLVEHGILFVVVNTFWSMQLDLYFLERIGMIYMPSMLYFEFVLLQDNFYIGIILFIIMMIVIISYLIECLSNFQLQTLEKCFRNMIISIFCISVIALGCHVGCHIYQAIDDMTYPQVVEAIETFF
ncbi:MAG: hypothetical protein LUG60_12790 [Erysipelotrichaceae bacterium]|nr:hypothetical protein [Erysipelotrichaceae bacterium]